MSRDIIQSRASPLEQLTGKSLDELTEDELLAWLEILGRYVDDEDLAQVKDVRETDNSPEKPDIFHELEGLAVLRNHGIITEKEFEIIKEQVLGLG